MPKLWLKYTFYRLGLFLGLTVVFGLVGIPWLFATIFGAMIAFAVSMIWLTGLRDELSKEIYSKRNREKDADEKAEDEN